MFNFSPPALSGKGDGGLGRIPLPPAPPRNGEGSLLFTPPALSGKGDGGLGRMRKVNFYIKMLSFCMEKDLTKQKE